jgi:hypothetical protein
MISANEQERMPPDNFQNRYRFHQAMDSHSR